MLMPTVTLFPAVTGFGVTVKEPAPPTTIRSGAACAARTYAARAKVAMPCALSRVCFGLLLGSFPAFAGSDGRDLSTKFTAGELGGDKVDIELAAIEVRHSLQAEG